MGFSPRFLNFKRLYFFTGSPKLAIRLIDEGEQYSPLWPLNMQESKKLLKRRFDFSGCSVEIPGRIFWQSELSSPAWYREFYSFRWLKDIAASQNHKMASSLGREFLYEFTRNLHAVPTAALEPDVMGMRIGSWMTYRYFLLKGGSLKFRKRFLRRAITEIGLLHQAFRQGRADSPWALQGLISAATVFHELHYLVSPLLRTLEETLSKIVLPDGMLISRNASEHMRLLMVLIEIRDTLGHVSVTSEGLQDAIMRMTSMLLMLTHGDGRLGLFNGNLMEDAGLITKIAQISNVSLQAFAFTSNSGFFRLERRSTIVLFAGRPTKNSAEDADYINSFEFSDRSERIVVNCGYYQGTHSEWQRALRQSSAHSSLSLQVKEKINLFTTTLVPTEFKVVDETKGGLALSDNILQEQDSGIYATSEQFFATKEGGVIHRRQIGLKNDGTEITGKDTLTPETSIQHPNFMEIKLRFHLHPDIRCQHPAEGEIILTSVKGSTWMLTLDKPQAIEIEESVYLGYYGKPQKTQQLVISPQFILPKIEIGWKFSKVI